MDTVNDKQAMLDRKTWAVVGASTDPQKYGNRVYRCLKAHGYEVYPVNPGADRVDGDAAYEKLEDLPKNPDVVNLVVPPVVGMKVARQCSELGISKLWMQPGAESSELLQYCDETGITAVAHECVLRELGC